MQVVVVGAVHRFNYEHGLPIERYPRYIVV